MIMRDIGTTPEVLLNPNPKRRRWWIQLLPVSVDTGNTGRVFVARGFVPAASPDDSMCGEVLIQSASIEEKEQYAGDPAVYKGAIWVVADAASQTIVYEEEVGE